MKLYLVSAFLLLAVLTGFADLAPAAPEVTTKVLYDREYIITESKEPRWVHYDFHSAGVRFRINNEDPEKRVQNMYIKEDFRWFNRTPDLAFAIETFSYKRGYKIDCLSSQLGKLIENCEGNVIVRNLTSSEKKQLQAFKDEQKETGSLFKIVYNKGEMRTQIVNITKFDVTAKHVLGGFFFNVDTRERFNSKVRSMFLQAEKLKESSFTIEGLPAGTQDVDCYGSHPSVDPVSCAGNITIYG